MLSFQGWASPALSTQAEGTTWSSLTGGRPSASTPLAAAVPAGGGIASRRRGRTLSTTRCRWPGEGDFTKKNGEDIIYIFEIIEMFSRMLELLELALGPEVRLLLRPFRNVGKCRSQEMWAQILLKNISFQKKRKIFFLCVKETAPTTATSCWAPWPARSPTWPCRLVAALII